MEASALPGSVGLARPRIGLGVPLLRLRSDEQLVSLFRAGNDDAFRVIHDRYRQRLQAYSRQMLAGSDADAEDVVQEIFVRAYRGLRGSDRALALRAWLYRIAHNRCIDEIRRPRPIATEAIEEVTAAPESDPISRLEQRDALQSLIADVRRLPAQQRSALLMRELGGMPYADAAAALGVSVAATKSLLVRARVGLAQAGEARDTACASIRQDLIVSHDRGVRTSGLARRHMRDCPECRRFRTEVRGVSRQLAALVPALGPIGVVVKLLGLGGAGSGGAAAGTGAVATSTAAAGGAGTGAVASVGAVAAGAGHVVTLIAAAAVMTAGGVIELQQIAHHAPQRPHHRHVVRAAFTPATFNAPPAQDSGSSPTAPEAADRGATAGAAAQPSGSGSGSRMARLSAVAPSGRPSTGGRDTLGTARHPLPISELIDPDHLGSYPTAGPDPSTPTAPGDPSTTANPAPGVPTTPSTTTTPTATTTTPTDGTMPGTVPTTTTTTTTTTTPTPSPAQGTSDGQPSTGVTPLTKTARTSRTRSHLGGRIVLGPPGAFTRRATVRMYRARHR